MVKKKFVISLRKKESNMDKEEKGIRYLEMIENIISRMAESAFRCKEFCILIVTGLLAVYATLSEKNANVILCCLVPELVFWILDSFYLFKERLYRELYESNKIIDRENVVDFKLKATSKNVGCAILNYLKAMFWSISTVFLYGLLIASTIVFYFIMR